jgi:hypothetical protein
MSDLQPPVIDRRYHPRGRSSFVWGLILVALGVIFLLQHFGLLGEQFNGWALFILLPVFGSWGTAWFIFRQNGGRFNAAVRSNLGGGLVVLTVALIFLFGADWRIWWPMMLVTPGITMILGSLPDPELRTHINVAGLVSMGFWFGLSILLLGLTFLLDRLQVINIAASFGNVRWWSAFIFIPGIGALVNAFTIFFRNEKRMNAASRVLIAIGVVILAVGAMAFLGLSWNLLWPVVLIAGGIALVLTTLVR